MTVEINEQLLQVLNGRDVVLGSDDNSRTLLTFLKEEGSLFFAFEKRKNVDSQYGVLLRERLALTTVLNLLKSITNKDKK